MRTNKICCLVIITIFAFACSSRSITKPSSKPDSRRSASATAGQGVDISKINQVTTEQKPIVLDDDQEISLEHCFNQGLAWKPATVQSGPAACSGKLVTDWCCKRETIVSRFYANASGITAEWDNPAKSFLKSTLYACSVLDGSTTSIPSYRLHFAGSIDGNLRYSYIDLTNLSKADTAVTGLDNCTQITTTSQLLPNAGTALHLGDPDLVEKEFVFDDE